MEDKIYGDLKGLRLSGMAQCWMLLQETKRAHELSFRDGVAMLIQSERTQRNANRTSRLMKNARFRYTAAVGDIIFDSARGRDREQLMQLATCDYIRQGASVLITGPTGVGKSFIASALGQQACLAGFKVKYANMQKLLEDITMARIESKPARFFDRAAETDLFVIEDFGMRALEGQQLIDFMEFIEDRHDRKSTIITSQLPVESWYDILAKNKTVADAIIDRLARTSHRITLRGDSMRNKRK